MTRYAIICSTRGKDLILWSVEHDAPSAAHAVAMATLPVGEREAWANLHSYLPGWCVHPCESKLLLHVREV